MRAARHAVAKCRRLRAFFSTTTGVPAATTTLFFLLAVPFLVFVSALEEENQNYSPLFQFVESHPEAAADMLVDPDSAINRRFQPDDNSIFSHLQQELVERARVLHQPDEEGQQGAEQLYSDPEQLTLRIVNTHASVRLGSPTFGVQVSERLLAVVALETTKRVVEEVEVHVAGGNSTGPRGWTIGGGVEQTRGVTVTQALQGYVRRFGGLFDAAYEQIASQWRNTVSKLVLFSGFTAWSSGLLAMNDPPAVALRRIHALYVGMLMVIVCFAREIARVPGLTVWTQTGHVQFYNFLLETEAPNAVDALYFAERSALQAQQRKAAEAIVARGENHENLSVEQLAAKLPPPAVSPDMASPSLSPLYPRTHAAVLENLSLPNKNLKADSGNGKNESRLGLPPELRVAELTGMIHATARDLPVFRQDSAVCKLREREKAVYLRTAAGGGDGGQRQLQTARASTPDAGGEVVATSLSLDDMLERIVAHRGGNSGANGGNSGANVLGKRLGYNFWRLRGETQYGADPCAAGNRGGLRPNGRAGVDWDVCLPETWQGRIYYLALNKDPLKPKFYSRAEAELNARAAEDEGRDSIDADANPNTTASTREDRRVCDATNYDCNPIFEHARASDLAMELHIHWVPRGIELNIATTRGGAATSLDEVMVWSATTDPLLAPGEEIDVLVASPHVVHCDLIADYLTADVITVAKILYMPFNPVEVPAHASASEREVWEGEATTNSKTKTLKTTVPPPKPLPIHMLSDEKFRSRVLRDKAFQDAMLVLTQCGLERTVAVLQPLGYRLLQVEKIFAIFVHESVAGAFFGEEEEGEPHAHQLQHQNAVYEKWLDGWFCSVTAKHFLNLETTFLYHDSLDGVNLLPLFSGRLAEERRVAYSKLMISSGDRTFKYFYTDPRPGVPALLQASKRGLCASRRESSVFCECFPPYRGPLCEFEDGPRRVEALGTTASAVTATTNCIHYVVDASHLDELAFALHNLWQMFNAKYDYPVLVFHDGSVPLASLQELLRRQENRVWTFLMSTDEMNVANKASTGPKSRLSAKNGGSSATPLHHHGSGYAEQARFRAGPMFFHPVFDDERFRYAFGLDTDSYFPREVSADVFPGMDDIVHRLGYKYLTRSTPANSQNLYSWLQMFLATQPTFMENKLLLWPKRMSGVEVPNREGTGINAGADVVENPSNKQATSIRAVVADRDAAKALEEAVRTELARRDAGGVFGGTTVAQELQEKSKYVAAAQKKQPSSGVFSSPEPLYERLLTTLPEYPLGFTWSLAVLMTDCEIVDVRFIRESETYKRWFSFIDSLGGMTDLSSRWGDHAVRGLGMAVSLWPEEASARRGASWEMTAVPYAHQGFCDCDAGTGAYRCVKVYDPKVAGGGDTVLEKKVEKSLGDHARFWTGKMRAKKLFTCAAVVGDVEKSGMLNKEMSSKFWRRREAGYQRRILCKECSLAQCTSEVHRLQDTDQCKTDWKREMTAQVRTVRK